MNTEKLRLDWKQGRQLAHNPSMFGKVQFKEKPEYGHDITNY